MYVRRIFLIILPILFIFVSCQYFEKKIPSQHDLLQKELESINWNEVDEFPSTDSCNVLDNRKGRQECFFFHMIKTIQQKLNVEALSVFYPHTDTIRIKVTIFPNSKIKFEPFLSQDSVSYIRSKIESVILNQLSDFPKIHPAIKHGIPVKTQFVLPIILNIE